MLVVKSISNLLEYSYLFFQSLANFKRKSYFFYLTYLFLKYTKHSTTLYPILSC